MRARSILTHSSDLLCWPNIYIYIKAIKSKHFMVVNIVKIYIFGLTHYLQIKVRSIIFTKEQLSVHDFRQKDIYFFLIQPMEKHFLLCGLNEVKTSYSKQRNHGKNPSLLWADVNTEKRLHGWKASVVLTRLGDWEVLRGVLQSNRPQECKSPMEPGVEPAGGLARTSDVSPLLGLGSGTPGKASGASR